MPHSHTRLVYCASLVRLLRCNFWIKGRVIFSQSARLSFLIVVQAPFAQVWALRAVIALVGLRRQTFVLVLVWTSGFPSLYIFMYTFCQSLISYSRHSQCEKSVRCGRLGKPSIKHRGVSWGIFCFSLAPERNPFLWAQTDRFHWQPREIRFNAAITQVAYCRSKWTALFLSALLLYFSFFELIRI